MKLRKRRISILLSMLLLLSVFQPAVALDVDPDFEQIYEIGTRLLGDIEHEKELYGLGGVNFDNLYIGEYIPAYIAKETGLTPSNIRYYPVLENGEWVATLSCYKVDDIWTGTLSDRYVKVLPEIDANDSLKLVFDSNTGYLFKNSAIHNLTSYNAVAGRVDIVSSPMTISVSIGQKLVNKRAVEIDRFNDNVVSQHSILVTSELPMNSYLNIPTVRQPGEWACPLSCLRSIAQYFRVYRTEEQLKDIYNNLSFTDDITYETGAQLTQIEHIVPNIGLYSTYYPTVISFSQFMQNLYDDKPMIMACLPTSATDRPYGHAIAARGYTEYTHSTEYAGSFSYMNPWTAAYEIGMVIKPNTYHYTYDRGDGTVSYSAAQFLAIYDTYN